MDLSKEIEIIKLEQIVDHCKREGITAVSIAQEKGKTLRIRQKCYFRSTLR